MKPRFEDFKLQFSKPTGSQVEDEVPSTSMEQKALTADYPMIATKAGMVPDKTPQGAGSIDFARIARKREETHADFLKKHMDEDHPWDATGLHRFNYDGPPIPGDREMEDNP